MPLDRPVTCSRTWSPCATDQTEVLQPIPIHILIKNVVPHLKVKKDMDSLAKQLLTLRTGVSYTVVGVAVDWAHVTKRLAARTPWSRHCVDSAWHTLAPLSQPRCSIYSRWSTPPRTQQPRSYRHRVCLTIPHRASAKWTRAARLTTQWAPCRLKRWLVGRPTISASPQAVPVQISGRNRRQLRPAMPEKMTGISGQRAANMRPRRISPQQSTW